MTGLLTALSAIPVFMKPQMYFEPPDSTTTNQWDFYACK